MSDVERLVDELDFYDPAFIDDPYPTLGRLREATPIFHNPRTGQWMLTRFDDVYETLRDRRLGRVYDHLYSHEELGQPGPDPRWASFNQHEKWSLLSLEPPDHTRIRRLVSKVFTPRSVAALEPRVADLSRELAERCREMGTFDLLSDYAQLFSVAVVGEVLGVPRRDTHHLLDWSHAIVKMYEFTVPEELKVRAETAAGEFIDYTKALVDDKRRSPDGTLVSKLVETSDAGDRLSNDEIVSTVMVLLEAGHEATVNTLGNGRAPCCRTAINGTGWSAVTWTRPRRPRNCCATTPRCSSSTAGCSNRGSRSPAGRWPSETTWSCSSGRPSAIPAGSISPTASMWAEAIRPTSASAAASTSASERRWHAPSWPSPSQTSSDTSPTWSWPKNRHATRRSPSEASPNSASASTSQGAPPRPDLVSDIFISI